MIFLGAGFLRGEEVLACMEILAFLVTDLFGIRFVCC